MVVFSFSLVGNWTQCISLSYASLVSFHSPMTYQELEPSFPELCSTLPSRQPAGMSQGQESQGYLFWGCPGLQTLRLLYWRCSSVKHLCFIGTDIFSWKKASNKGYLTKKVAQMADRNGKSQAVLKEELGIRAFVEREMDVMFHVSVYLPCVDQT